MEMKAIEEITIGEDLTPTLRPIAAALRYSALNTHCSACFSALPPPPEQYFPSTRDFPDHLTLLNCGISSPLYCSIRCVTNDSNIHNESHEQHLLYLLEKYPLSSWPETQSAILRLALRIAWIFQKIPEIRESLPKTKTPFQPDREQGEILERVMGLMTHRKDLILTVMKKLRDEGKAYDESLDRIREGVAIMATARRNDSNKYWEIIAKLRGAANKDKNVGYALEEIALCWAMTNAVEIMGENGNFLGVAVYDYRFSWINHSCSPNSCHVFLHDNCEQRLLMRIAPSGEEDSILRFVISDRVSYGPRICVRSIKSIGKDEAVTIAYTDLLMFKEKRQKELWSKYRFNCSCNRCCAVPTGYADTYLPALSADSPKNPESAEMEQRMQNVNLVDTIRDYMSKGDSVLCCRNLEYLLCYGDFSYMSLESNEAESPQKRKLHLFHYFSINAYIALASAYKARGKELSALNSEGEAMNMYKTCSAYSLLLAGVVNHLFMSEPSMVMSAECYWRTAGESLFRYYNSAFLKHMPIEVDMSYLLTLYCADCTLVADLDPDRKEMHLEEMKSQLYNCIAKLTPRVWKHLASKSEFLKSIQNPVDLSWVHDTREALEVDTSSGLLGKNLVDIGLHCLKYGALLSSICYGESFKTNYRAAREAVKKTCFGMELDS